ncbi:MAG TPA: hypothetical protein ENH20_01175, partial [Candidatus Pacearchaeota archaeon]|nr:hypothetical protein [Candidatus Pacearchaeota archaeon]
MMEEGDDDLFVNLYDLLEEDSEKILEIKSLYQREEEYVMFLGPVEFFIANYYYHENRKLSDVKLTRHLRNVKRNFDKDLEFFSEDFEWQLMNLLSCVLQNEGRKISRHELGLVVGYVLWSIDNRKCMGDKRGYLKWICGFFGILNEEEKTEVDDLVEDCGKMFGKSEDVIKSMKGEDSDVEFNEEETRLSRIDSESFAGDDVEG